jgi:molecular chaperone HscB
VNLQSDDFELFGLKRRFLQDRSEIDTNWKMLQRQAHPDRFAAQQGAAQRLSMQWSVRINEAYQRLKDPLRRAAYLCELNGVPVDAQTNTAMPQQFLLQQMQWRETLEEATGPTDLLELQSLVDATERELMAQCADSLDRQNDAVAAAQQVRSIMFIQKFARDLRREIEKFD